MKRALFFLLALIITPIIFAQQNSVSEVYRTDEPQLTIDAVPNQTFSNFELSTNIPNVNAYLNGVYLGKTPLTTRNINPGVYTLTLEKTGYYERDFYITLNAGTNNALYIELLRISGFLSIEKDPEDAQVFIDGKEEKSSLVELYEGDHLVEIKKFGFETYSKTHTILRNQREEITVQLERADFLLSDLQANTVRFNPKNPANLGVVGLSFDVTAPGNGFLTVVNEQNKKIREVKLSSFTTWAQNAAWDGKNNAQEIVEDGQYTIIVQTTGLDGSSFEERISVEVDSSITYLLQNLSFLGGSFGLNPSPILFPQGTISTSFELSPSFVLDQYSFSGMPVSFNLIYTPLDWLEVSGHFAFHVYNEQVYAGSGAGSVKAILNTNNIYYGGYIRYGYSNEPLLVPYTSSGLGGGIVVGYQITPVTLSAYGEYVIGNAKGLFENTEHVLTSGLAAHAQWGIFSTALWGKWISTEAIYTGIDFSLIIPATTIICNLGTAFNFDFQAKNTMSYKLGLSMLF